VRDSRLWKVKVWKVGKDLEVDKLDNQIRTCPNGQIPTNKRIYGFQEFSKQLHIDVETVEGERLESLLVSFRTACPLRTYPQRLPKVVDGAANNQDENRYYR
jgi:hypothetical protein